MFHLADASRLNTSNDFCEIVFAFIVATRNWVYCRSSLMNKASLSAPRVTEIPVLIRDCPLEIFKPF